MNAGQAWAKPYACWLFHVSNRRSPRLMSVGRGFRVCSSFVLFITFAGIADFIDLAVTIFVHMLLKWKRERRSRVKVILVGLDGQDPD